MPVAFPLQERIFLEQGLDDEGLHGNSPGTSFINHTTVTTSLRSFPFEGNFLNKKKTYFFLAYGSVSRQQTRICCWTPTDVAPLRYETLEKEMTAIMHSNPWRIPEWRKWDSSRVCASYFIVDARGEKCPCMHNTRLPVHIKLLLFKNLSLRIVD